MADAKTVGDLKSSGYKILPIREEMRRNLMVKLRLEDEVFPGIIGYKDTVIPQL